MSWFYRGGTTMFKNLSKRAYTATMALALVITQVIAPIQPAFADNDRGGNGGNDGNMIYCHQQQNGNWKVDMGAPNASDNNNRFVIGYLQPGESWADVKRSANYQPSVCAEFNAFNAPNLTPATCDSLATLSATYTTSALDYQYSLDNGATKLPLETNTAVEIPNGSTVYVYVYNALVPSVILKTFGPYEVTTPVCVEPTKVTPKPVAANDTCGTLNDKITWTPTTGLEYYYTDPATGQEVILPSTVATETTTAYTGGQTITVMARVTGEEYVLDAEAQTEWTLEFSNDPCQTEVTPLIAIEQMEVCGPDNDVLGMTLPEDTEGVVFLGDGSLWYEHVTYRYDSTNRSYTLIPDNGYFLPEGTQTLYQINDTNTPCPAPVYTPVTCDVAVGYVTVTFDEEAYDYYVSGTGMDGETPLTSGLPFAIDKQGTYIVTGYWYEQLVYTSDSFTYPTLTNCTPGQGGGGSTPVTPVTPTTPVNNGVLPATTPLPSPIELPHTGASDNGIVIALVAALATYGAVYFAQPKRHY